MQAQGGMFRVVKLDGKPLKCGPPAAVGSEVRQWTGVRVTSCVFATAFERCSFALSRLVSSSASVNLNMSSLHFLPARLLTPSASNGSWQASSSQLLCYGFRGRDIKCTYAWLK